MTEVISYIGLGSNLDDPQSQVEQAIRELGSLPQTRLVRSSSLYRSAPIGPPGQDDYINAVAEIETSLDAWQLLDELHQIENAHQRQRLERWGARTLDLDILLYADMQIQDERLTLPHEQMAYRSFVLEPLCELVGTDYDLPGLGKLQKLMQECPDNALTKMA